MELTPTNLADPPRKLDLHDGVAAWLLAVGPNGLRVKDILVAFHDSSRKQCLTSGKVRCMGPAVTRQKERCSHGTVESHACGENHTWYLFARPQP